MRTLHRHIQLLLAALLLQSTALQADLLTDVKEWLITRSEVEHDSVQVIFKARAMNWPPVGTLLTVEPLSRKLRGTVVVDALLTDGGSVRLTARVRTWDNLWCATRRIARGEAIFSDMIIPQLVETTRLRQDLWPVADSPLGMVAGRRIAAEDLLTRTALDSPDAVTAGGDVQLRLSCGPVQIDDFGRALQSGAVGEQILVRSESTGKVLTGSITPGGVVFCRIE